MMSRINSMLLLALLALCSACEAPTIARNPAPIVSSSIVEVWRTPKASIHPKGSYEGGASISTAPLIEGEKIYFAYDSVLECLDINTGANHWRASLIEGLGAQAVPSLYLTCDEILSDDGNLYVLSAHAILCHSKIDGRRLWAFIMSDEMGSFADASCTSSDAIYLTTWDSHELIKLDKRSGAVVWRSKGAVLEDAVYENVKFISHPTAPAVVGNRVYVGGRYGRGQIPGINHDGTVACFDAESGTRLWIKLIPRADSTAGYKRWDLLTENEIRRPPVPYEGGVIVESGFCVIRMDSSGNTLWRRTPNFEGNVGQYGTNLKLRDGRLYVINDFYSYCMNPEDGEQIWSNWLSPQVGDGHTFHNPMQFTPNRMFALSDDWYVIGADRQTGNVSFAADMYYHLVDADKYDTFLEGAFTVFDDKFVAVDLNYIYCWQILP